MGKKINRETFINRILYSSVPDLIRIEQRMLVKHRS